jgi:hypothetical protein
LAVHSHEHLVLDAQGLSLVVTEIVGPHHLVLQLEVLDGLLGSLARFDKHTLSIRSVTCHVERGVNI